MKIELGFQALYEQYKEKRENLPLYYCHRRFEYNYIEGGVHMLKTVDEGFYRCEDMGSGRIKVYDTYVGIILSKNNRE